MFATPQETERRLCEAGFTSIRCWLEDRPTYPQDVDQFVRTSIVAAYLGSRPIAQQRREQFATAVVAVLRLPLDHVRLNVSALRSSRPAGQSTSTRRSTHARKAISQASRNGALSRAGRAPGLGVSQNEAASNAG
jgi:hypothetical protein